MMELPNGVYNILFFGAVLAFLLLCLLLIRFAAHFNASSSLLHFGNSGFNSWWKIKGEKSARPVTEIEKLSLLVKELEAARRELESQQAKMEEALLLVERDNYRKTEELLEAQQLQLAMLPQHTPFMPGYEIAFYSLPASEVGGDYYDYHFSNSNRKLHLVLGDATGHGFKPAILVATAKSYFKTLAGKEESEGILTHISGAIKSLNARGLYMGLSLIDVEGDRVSVVSSGMPPVYVYKHNKPEVQQHRLKGMFLGVNPTPPLHRKVFRMHKGDVILLMTDGLAESQSASGEMLGYEVITDKFKEAAAANKSSSEIMDYLLWVAESWSENSQQRDDVSMMVLRKK
jgi:serine phosphatase RsbU (regulator of sigma subunit)